VNLVKRRIFARFDDAAVARRCLKELRGGVPARPGLEVWAHSGTETFAEMPVVVSHVREALVRGVLTGGFIGSTLGILLGALGHRFDGMRPAFVIAFGAMGFVLGALAAVLSGSMNPHPEIDRLASGGAVVIVVDSREPEERLWAEHVLLKWHAFVEHETSGGVVTTVAPEPGAH
jgi:hypothetical protein